MKLHAHVSTFARDCDGGHGSDRISRLNDEEVAEHQNAQGINDFHDLHFKARILGDVVSFLPLVNAEVKVTPLGFEYHETTDEGFTSTEVVWCEDACTDPQNSEYDEYAEMMGY